MYAVKSIFYTLQGEGAQAGSPAVFCRFAGCNLWSGREADRASAACRFCDTDFVGTDGINGGKFADAQTLATAIAAAWPAGAAGNRLTVLTGGEPGLQIDQPLIAALHERQFRIAVETNGTIVLPPGLDWITVSPKAGNPLKQRHGQELKVVVPQPALSLEALRALPFEHHYVQAMDDADPIRRAANQSAAVSLCLRDPRWRLSVQTHKWLNID